MVAGPVFSQWRLRQRPLWTPQRLVWMALLLAWSAEQTLTGRFEVVRDLLHALFPQWRRGQTYTGLVLRLIVLPQGKKQKMYLLTNVRDTAALLPSAALAADATPRPIPGGTETPFGFFHFNFPGPADEPGHEPSLITDFQGHVGVLEFEGTGHGTGYDDPLPFSGDVRFMQGAYRGVDGCRHHGTFAFI